VSRTAEEGGACEDHGLDDSLDWRDEWFERDGAWPEMTLLAEKIAAAI